MVVKGVSDRLTILGAGTPIRRWKWVRVIIQRTCVGGWGGRPRARRTVGDPWVVVEGEVACDGGAAGQRTSCYRYLRDLLSMDL